ncbi:transposase [Planobispora siamensis]|uniref:transposase n=1 Tax=Planobispora siamensis TaxID=936338 RepID=UPI0035ECF371
MDSRQWDWIVPKGLWEIVRPLLPTPRVRPQGGGITGIADEAVFAAIVYVLVRGCAWRGLPPCFGASKSRCAPPLRDLVAGWGVGAAAPGVSWAGWPPRTWWMYRAWCSILSIPTRS